MPKIPNYEIEEYIHVKISNPELANIKIAKKNLCSSVKNDKRFKNKKLSMSNQ